LDLLQKEVGFCKRCYRSTEVKNVEMLCDICSNSKRLAHLIAVIEKESDMQNLEKTGSFQGQYHVLGGVINPLDSDSPRRLHLKSLYERIQQTLATQQKCEVILATNPTTEGDTTALYIERILSSLKNTNPSLSISRLGRGLSLGSELEHVDEMTLRNAFINRK